MTNSRCGLGVSVVQTVKASLGSKIGQDRSSIRRVEKVTHDPLRPNAFPPSLLGHLLFPHGSDSFAPPISKVFHMVR